MMGDFNHQYMQWRVQGVRTNSFFLRLIQDSFLTQHVLDTSRGDHELDVVLPS